jgi:hypothetical protein
MPEPIFMKLGTYVMAPEAISKACFINPYQFLCLYVYHLIVVRQRLGKNVTVEKDTHATIEELLDAWFSMRAVPYQKKLGD